MTMVVISYSIQLQGSSFSAKKIVVCLAWALLGVIAPAGLAGPGLAAGNGVCEYWVAPIPLGNDANSGSFGDPWATLEHAAESAQDNYCTVWFKEGEYSGSHRLTRRFTTPTTFKAIAPYRVVMQNMGKVVHISGGRNILIEGFIFRHSGPEADALLFVIDRNAAGWAKEITLRNNIFHDAFNNDLLKVHNGSHFITIEGNIFYNQGPSEQQIDVNSVMDMVIQDNIFFNDFPGSGRKDLGNTKAFITIKDSNENEDGLIGSERVVVRRNIFLKWQGGSEPFIQVGNDGKAYHEATDVLIENNLMIGNSTSEVNALLAVSGARNVRFVNNTVAGNLPSRAYAIRVDRKEANPPNQDVFLYNNIWSDPTGTMGARTYSGANNFSNGDPDDISNLVLDNNLYWNGGLEIPPGNLISPLVDDKRAVAADPQLNTNQVNVTLPRWNGSSFRSGNATIRQEFIRLVLHYGLIPENSPAAGAADPHFSPAEDILGNPRPAAPSLGAVEYFQWRFTYLPVILRIQSAPR